MTRPVVFAGPSIARRGRADDPVREGDLSAVDLRRPASAGDILDAAEQGAPVIALIDGFFDRVPAPWHKEILLALDSGVPVIGGASLGALRAAELDRYGMVGIGWVYSQYASGAINDDDEVAVAHRLDDDGDFSPVSDAMVDIRWALAGALEEEHLGADEHDRLIELAKGRFYAERSFAQLLSDARADELPSAADAELWNRLRDPARSIKRMDAHAVIEAAIAAVGSVAPPVGAEVPETGLVRRLRAASGHRHSGAAATAIVQELRLDPAAYQFVWTHALRTELGVRESERVRYEPPDEQVDMVQGAIPFGPEVGLGQRRGVARREAAAHHVSRVLAPEVDHRLVDALHVLGLYGDVNARAERKSEVVGAPGQRPMPAGDRPSEEDVIGWYFATVLGQALPDDVEQWATTMGYRSTADFADALVREWAFRARAEEH